MFGKKKEVRDVQRSKANRDLSKYGLLDIPRIDGSGFDMNDDDDDGDDAALEAELLALTAGTTPMRPKPKASSTSTAINLDAMVAESLRDIPSDDEVSVDEDDPALLNELSGLVSDDNDDDDVTTANVSSKMQTAETNSPENKMIVLLQGRKSMYEEAEKNARSSGETKRSRRFERGIKTLNNMIQQASAGRVINEEDIPPPVVTAAKKATVPAFPSDDLSSVTLQPSRPAPPPPPKILQNNNIDENPEGYPTKLLNEETGYVFSNNASSVDKLDDFMATDSPVGTQIIEALLSRQNEYKVAALHAKKDGKMEEALKYVKIVKQFEPVIGAARAGHPVDLSTIPPPPQYDKNKSLQLSENSTQQQPVLDSIEFQKNSEIISSTEEQGEHSGTTEALFSTPPTPSSVLEALEQRLEKYRNSEESAKKEGNMSKVRRMGRIVKQYESAIKLHKTGKPIPVDELPTPPGFAPIPVEGTEVTITPNNHPTNEDPQEPDKQPLETNVTIPPQEEPHSSAESNGQSGNVMKTNVRKSPQSRQEKQLALLVARQKKFRDAAIEAKRKGEINQAKEYLRLAKGFDPLIEASQNGLPVDLASLPIPPENKKELEGDFDIVTLEDCIPGSDSEIYEKLEEDLLRQTKMCLTTRDHFKATGDIASANRFEQLALDSKKDLDAVKCAHKRRDPVPKFHYETRTFNIVQCCTELSDNDLELSIIQGINYNVPNPKDIDTYVKFEFPYPTDTPVRDRTALIKDTNNPQYNQTFLISIQRNVRACQRIFKRQSIKLEVWSRGGFFRGDSLLGNAAVKLMPLETRCTIHDAFDLMDGRKAVGGKLEVKVRIRNPILTKQVEQVQEKWLVIDKYL